MERYRLLKKYDSPDLVLNPGEIFFKKMTGNGNYCWSVILISGVATPFTNEQVENNTNWFEKIKVENTLTTTLTDETGFVLSKSIRTIDRQNPEAELEGCVFDIALITSRMNSLRQIIDENKSKL